MNKLLALCAALLVPHAPLLCAATGVAVKYPGKKSTSYSLQFAPGGGSAVDDALPLRITRTVTPAGDCSRIDFTIVADTTCWFSLADTVPAGMASENCEFYMPGFWYHKNLRSPQKAPSIHTSDSWSVREDRLSAPLAGIYDTASKRGMTVLRIFDGKPLADCCPQNLSGEVILPQPSSVGTAGFCNKDGEAMLVFGFPFFETPKRYIRKLTLIEPVRSFHKICKGDTVRLSWQLRSCGSPNYSDFVADTWNYCFDTMRPSPVDNAMTRDEALKAMVPYFTDSYVDDYELKYFSGMRMRTDDCLNTDNFQVGFVGRVLLNAFNALEYGETHNLAGLVAKANAILGSVLEHGFTPEGFFRENVKFSLKTQKDELSIRRQSEGAYAILAWLNYEQDRGRSHPEWEARIKCLMDRLMTLQNRDGSFPRKFKADGSVIDPSGGSTPSATLPLAMAYDFFADSRYLGSARRTGTYLERELISKGDYFSSTLDANCEDKEASLYASTAMYYLACATKGDERERNMELCRRAAYFCLSWYYMWDVPFAPGQMLGDVGFRSRGWGNVSVENNHIDVFIFDFASVLDKLAEHYGEKRFSDFASVIKTSMLQLMPTEDNMYDIAKAGYYPEVIQHTTWDYGRNGKGFYNDIFAPGWTVASLWQMLCPERVDNWFKNRNSNLSMK